MAITSVPVLVSSNTSVPFQIEADSLYFATEAILSQEFKTDGKWYLIVFFSKSLFLVEWNYEIHNKKMLAIIQALEEWWYFFEDGLHFVKIWTDHHNMEYFMTANKLNHKQAQWSLCLVRFNFLLHHCLGKSMGKPDALSQWLDHRDGSQDNMDIVLLKPELLAVHALVGIAFEGKKQALLTNI